MDPATAYVIGQALMAGGGALGSWLGGGSGDYPGGSAIGRPEWWQMQGPLTRGFGGAEAFGQQITPEYMGHLQNAISGNMGLSPEVIQMMFGRQKQAMAPQHAMQQDVLKSSFNPRLAGSGAAGAAMGKLLGGQGQQMTGALTDINIQDLLGRFGTQQQALGQYGQAWGTGQGMQLGWANAINRWLGQ